MKRPWCWERLKAGGEGDDRAWDGWIALPTQWTWVWASSGRWWWTGKPGMLQSMGLQRVGHGWVTALNWIEKCKFLSLLLPIKFYSQYEMYTFYLIKWKILKSARNKWISHLSTIPWMQLLTFFQSISVLSFFSSVEIVVYIIVCKEIFVIIWYMKSVCPFS